MKKDKILDLLFVVFVVLNVILTVVAISMHTS
jgi:hypothetical protein